MSGTQVQARVFEAGQCIAGAGGASLVTSLTYPGGQASPHGSAITPLAIAAGGHGPALTYSASGLPTGLSINSGTGQISGTPSVVGLYSPIVAILDASTGVSQSMQFDWIVT